MPYRYLTALCVVVSCTQQDTPQTQVAFPPSDRILARHVAGGWENIDFVHQGDAIAESKHCVETHRDAEAIACFAFATKADHDAARPETAGNFKGDLCWDARWQRNKLGSQSGGENSAKAAACPSYTAPAPEPPPPASTAGPLTVTIDFEIERDAQGRARILGATNLPSGMALSFSISSSAQSYLAQDKGEVRDGKFTSTWFSLRGRGFPAGDYEVGVTVPFYNAQPESAKRVLGARLENMQGPLVRLVNPNLPEMGKVASLERVLRF